MLKKKQNKILMIIYCLAISIVLLLICTKSSPLYPLNDWVDSNAFFTMGKGMMNGKVLYRDLFEQKGPLLYLIHGIAYLISNKTFLGVYIFEVISFTLFLYFCHKIINIYFERKYSYIALPLIGAVILNIKNFAQGDSAEEFCIPLLTISLYYLIRYFNKEYKVKPIENKVLLLNGFLAGCVLWIKYSMLGFWFAWMMMIFFASILDKRYKDSIKECFVFLLGMLIATLPWIVYFGVNGAIKEWIDTYIFVNLNSYTVSFTLHERVEFIINTFRNGFKDNIIYAVFLVVGAIGSIFTNKYMKNIIGKIALIAVFFFLLLGVYGGGRGYMYYFFIFSPFMIFGVLILLSFIKFISKDKLPRRLTLLIGILIIIISIPLTLKYNRNVYLLNVKKDQLAQYKFAEIINKTPDATLLNYGSLDNGFYITTGITPDFKHFEIQNIPHNKFPENRDEQNRYVKEAIPDYIVMKVNSKMNVNNIKPKYIWNNYEVVAEQTQRIYVNKKVKYVLFKRKGL